jgi:hypothetical protein
MTEYRIIYQNVETAKVFLFINGIYQQHGILAKASVIKTSIFEGIITIDSEVVFEE